MANNPINTGDKSTDLRDSAKDRAKMQPEYTTIDLPEVKDIPGQENIVPLPLGELADDTIASAGEEADGLFAEEPDEEEEEPEGDSNSNVSAVERADLEEAANDIATEDDANLHEAALDDTDDDGTPLNERSSKTRLSGSDLDVPGAEEDDEDEEAGSEDEENNEYSLGGDNHDDIPEDDF